MSHKKQHIEFDSYLRLHIENISSVKQLCDFSLGDKKIAISAGYRHFINNNKQGEKSTFCPPAKWLVHLLILPVSRLSLIWGFWTVSKANLWATCVFLHFIKEKLCKMIRNTVYDKLNYSECVFIWLRHFFLCVKSTSVCIRCVLVYLISRGRKDQITSSYLRCMWMWGVNWQT